MLCSCIISAYMIMYTCKHAYEQKILHTDLSICKCYVNDGGVTFSMSDGSHVLHNRCYYLKHWRVMQAISILFVGYSSVHTLSYCISVFFRSIWLNSVGNYSLVSSKVWHCCVRRLNTDIKVIEYVAHCCIKQRKITSLALYISSLSLGGSFFQPFYSWL
jgi:hypothetical protein